MYVRVYVRAFMCVCSFSSKLLQELPRTIHPRTVSFDAAAMEEEKLTVGIIGCGHLGKQLTNVLLKVVPVPPENLQISTRRPDSLGEDPSAEQWVWGCIELTKPSQKVPSSQAPCWLALRYKLVG